MPDSLLARTWKNIVLRAALYYVALAVFTWLLRRIPVAQQVMRGSFDQLVSGGGFTGLGGPSSLSGVGSAPISEATLALTVLVGADQDLVVRGSRRERCGVNCERNFHLTSPIRGSLPNLSSIWQD